MANSDYMDVISFRARGDGKAYPHKIGSAKRTDKGISVFLDSLPIPDKDGRVSLLISAPRESSGSGGSGGNPRRAQPARRQDDFEDDTTIPF